MKRFHVHVAVESIPESVRFYSRLFGAEPSVVKTDYAKWMLDDPRVNFAISARGRPGGVNHLGFQVDSAEELAELRAQAAAADLPTADEGVVNCCYARSDKYWTTDPQGIPWETFQTLDSVPVYGAASGEMPAACCAPATAEAKTAARCCG